MRLYKRLALLAILALLLVLPGDVGARTRPWQNLGQTWITGYTDSGLTATGTWARPGEVAVDPRVIPLGSLVSIQGLGTYRAEDTGGAVLGKHVDVWVGSVAKAYAITSYRRVRWR